MQRTVRRFTVFGAPALTSTGADKSVGDEALVQHLVAALSREDHVVARAAINVRRADTVPIQRRGRPSGASLRETVKAIRSTDVVVIGGGTLLQETGDGREDRQSWRRFGLLVYVVRVAVTARFLRRPVRIVGVGAESLDSAVARWLARTAVRLAESVSVRDARSADLVRAVSGRVPVLGADTMFIDGVPLPETRSVTGPTVAVSLRADAGDELIDRLVRVLTSSRWRDHVVVLVAMDREVGEDESRLTALAAKLDGRRVRWVSERADWEEVFSNVRTADLAVGMRLHFAIFGVLASVPTVMLTTSSKTVAAADEMGIIGVSAHDGDVDAGVAAAVAADADRVDVLRARAAAMYARVVE